MAYMYYNSNPFGKNVGDCVIRGVAKVMGLSWLEAYTQLAMYGMDKGDIPSSNALWGAYLKENGFKVYPLPDDCPDCYTVKNFADEHKKGTYLLATGSHVVPLIDGIYMDTWDSGSEIVTYYFERVENNDIQS